MAAAHRHACSVGKPSTPTITGDITIKNRVSAGHGTAYWWTPVFLVTLDPLLRYTVMDELGTCHTGASPALRDAIGFMIPSGNLRDDLLTTRQALGRSVLTHNKPFRWNPGGGYERRDLNHEGCHQGRRDRLCDVVLTTLGHFAAVAYVYFARHGSARGRGFEPGAIADTTVSRPSLLLRQPSESSIRPRAVGDPRPPPRSVSSTQPHIPGHRRSSG